MDIKDLSPEQLEKVKACDGADELIALAKSEGVELTDEQLEKVAGGWETAGSYVICTQCNKKVYWDKSVDEPEFCPWCGKQFYWG